MCTDISKLLDVEIAAVNDINDTDYDGIIVVAAPDLVGDIKEFSRILTLALQVDNGLRSEVGVIPLPDFKANRLIYSPTGCVDEDYDDVRCFRRAATIGIRRAIKAGVHRPMVYLVGHPSFSNSPLVTLIGILEGLYVPLQIREFDPNKIHDIKKIGVYTRFPDELRGLIRVATTLEIGRRVACDIGEPDPERMSPPKVTEFIKNLFSNSSISLSIIHDEQVFAKEYPLFEAVNRAASKIERHQGRIIFLEYQPKEQIEKSLFLVGKGVTYDTGGIDVKIQGSMMGMSRDKCGAAAVAGFMQIVNIIKPKHMRIVGAIGVVRNSVGSNGYVQDELIKARSGVLVRIGNTDAEGRMIMADVLCKCKEMALKAVNPHLYTIATLTGHASLAVGLGYNIVIDNGPAKKEKHAQKLQLMGEEISDPFEVSSLRREDFNSHKGKNIGDDVLQSSNKPSSVMRRGHQSPCAFLMMASGLDKHGSGDANPLKYSHLDIAGSIGDYPDPITGAPVLALANFHLLNIEDCSKGKENQ